LRRTRIAIQVASLALFMFLVFVNVYPLAFAFPVDLFMRLDPYSGLGAMLISRSWIWRLAPCLLLLGSALVLGRVFCGYVCPMGTMLDCSSRVFGLKCKARSHRRLSALKYYILFATLAAAAAGAGLLHFFDPITIAERSGIFVVRQVASAAAVAVGGGVNRLGPVFEDRFYGLSALFAAMLLGILALELVNRRFWCRYLCPLGAMLSLAGRFARVSRRVSGCESTDICKTACVFGAIGDDPRTTRRGECTLCQRCKPVCPHSAISFSRYGGTPEGVWIGRRAFAASLAAGLAYGVLPGGRALAKPPRRKPIRPPGALPEHQFVATCTRCGVCIGACLTGGLQPALLEAGLEGMWTPVLVGRLGGCEAECNLCGKVCNTQAIRYLALQEKKKVKMGKAVIDRDLCLAWGEERVCYICDEVCPVGAIGFVREKNPAFDKPVVRSDKCTGCGLCEWKCPVEPPAIYVIPLEEEAL
jgi:MauM/NapG family ferredoxin protein